MSNITCNNQCSEQRAAIETLDFPPDKSISQRALLVAAMCNGDTTLYNLNTSSSVMALVEALRTLGVKIIRKEHKTFVVAGFSKSCQNGVPVLDLGSSSAAARFLIGVLSGLGLAAIIDGDKSLRARPMDWVVNPLRQLGASLEYLMSEGHLPVKINASILHGGKVAIEVGSAQASSAILFAAFAAGIEVEITQPVLSRDHTAKILQYNGANISYENNRYTIRAAKNAVIPYNNHHIPTDPSGLAYIFAAHILQKRNHRLTVTNTCLNPTRCGFFEILKNAGVPIRYSDLREEFGEPVGTLEIGHTERMLPITVNDNFIFHAAIDEIPLIAAMCLFAAGESRLLNAQELAFKETNRLVTTQLMLQDFGARLQPIEGGLVIPGGQKIHAGKINSFGDHRIAMTAAVLACSLPQTSEITGGDCYTTSFPDFAGLMNALGYNIRLFNE